MHLENKGKKSQEGRLFIPCLYWFLNLKHFYVNAVARTKAKWWNMSSHTWILDFSSPALPKWRRNIKEKELKYGEDKITPLHEIHNKHENNQITLNCKLVIKEESSNFLLLKVGSITSVGTCETITTSSRWLCDRVKGEKRQLLRHCEASGWVINVHRWVARQPHEVRVCSTASDDGASDSERVWEPVLINCLLCSIITKDHDSTG